jgi:hypothetical protein
MIRRITSREIWKSSIGFFLLLLVIAQATAWAQGEASISGIVTDSTGASIAGATVKVKNLETSSIRTLVTDGAGRYDASLLGVGKYEVTAEQTGFRTERKTGITLVLGQRAAVDIKLAVGEVQQTVQVEETALQLSVTTSEFSGLVGEQQVKDLPLNGRSYDQLEPRDCQLYVAAGRRDRNIQFGGRQHVFRFGPPPAGKPLHFERG